MNDATRQKVEVMAQQLAAVVEPRPLAVGVLFLLQDSAEFCIPRVDDTNRAMIAELLRATADSLLSPRDPAAAN